MPVRLQLNRQAHIANRTVKKFITTSDSADSTSFAMVLFFILIVE